MATKFTVNNPITTTTNFVDVDSSNLTSATHTFQLVVVDEAGNHSNPTKANVIVQFPLQ
jgi:hypothetical protein